MYDCNNKNNEKKIKETVPTWIRIGFLSVTPAQNLRQHENITEVSGFCVMTSLSCHSSSPDPMGCCGPSPWCDITVYLSSADKPQSWES